MSVRKTLPEGIRNYYDDIDQVDVFDWPDKVEKLEVKKYFFGLYKRTLYRLPDAYKVDGQRKDIYVYHYTVGKNKRPTVICNPILGGKLEEKDGKYKHSFDVAEMMAFFVAGIRRWNALIVGTDNAAIFRASDTPLGFEFALKNVVYNNIQAIQFVKTLKNTDVNNIFAMGASLGGLTVTIMTAIEDSIKSAIIIVAGGPLCEVITQSVQGLCDEYTKRMMKVFDMTREQVAEMLRETLITDTLELGKNIPDDTAFMVTAEKDVSVPTENQKKLVDVVKPAEHHHLKFTKYFTWLGKAKKKLKDGHYLAFGGAPYFMIRAIWFMSKRRVK